MTVVLRLLLLSLCLLGVSGAAARNANTLALDGYSIIALSRMKNGHLTLQARINGIPGRFVLDTGAGRSVIEASRQAQFGLSRIADGTGWALRAGGNLRLRKSHRTRPRIWR